MGDSVISVSAVTSYPVSQSENTEDSVVMIQSSRPSIIGRVRTCGNVTPLEWSLMVLSSITILTGLGFSIYRMFSVGGDSGDLVFSLLIVVNLFYATYYLFHGIFQEQPFEICTLTLTTILVWILIVINYITTPLSNSGKNLKMIRFVVASALTVPTLVPCCIVAWGYWTSGNLIFKTVGAEIKLQICCRQLFFGFSLLVFDAQAAISCLILVIQQGVGNMTNEQGFIVVMGCLYVAIWVSIGYTAMRTENIPLTWFFGFASIPQILYVIYLFVQAMDLPVNQYTVLSVCIYVSGVTLTSTHLILLTMLPIIAGNYGKGLREKIYGAVTPPAGQRPHQPSTSRSGLTPSPTTGLLHSGQDDHSNYDSITVLP